MLRRFPLYPILFSIFPVLSLAAYNIGQISLDVILRPLVVSLFMGLILFGLLGWILRDRYRAALAALMILLFFFLYGHIYNVLEDITLWNVSVFRHRTLLPFFGILLAVGLYFIARRLQKPGEATLWLNLLSIFFLIYPTYTIISNSLAQWSADRAVNSSLGQLVNKTNQPDIYYMILDAYGRQDVLQNLLGYDNSEFLNALRQRGFYVAECSQSNYAHTEWSLTAALNYDYLDHLDVSNARTERIALLKHNAVRSFLKANGYTIVAFPTGWTFTEWKDADLYVDYEHPVTSLTEFEKLLLDTTAFRVVSDLRPARPADASRRDLRRLRVFSLLENIKKLPEKEGKLFVFAHVPVPHSPYSFGPDGEVPAFDARTATREDIAAAYVDQVRFVNKEILKVIDALIETSEVPPVIIVQGDHGPLPDLATHGSERMPILNAYYLPGVEMDKILYPSISPVNSFRVVLNSYFDQGLSLLEDHSYFATQEDRTEFELVPNSCPNKP